MTTDRTQPTQPPTRFARIVRATEHPLTPSAHWVALAAYASELAELYGWTDGSRSIRRPIIADRLA